MENHSKQIDFSFSAVFRRRSLRWGKWLAFSCLYDKCRWSLLHRHLSFFLWDSVPVSLFPDNFLAVHDINAFLQPVEGMGFFHIALHEDALQSVDVCRLHLLFRQGRMNGRTKIVRAEYDVDSLSEQDHFNVDCSVEFVIGNFTYHL